MISSRISATSAEERAEQAEHDGAGRLDDVVGGLLADRCRRRGRRCRRDRVPSSGRSTGCPACGGPTTSRIRAEAPRPTIVARVRVDGDHALVVVVDADRRTGVGREYVPGRDVRVDVVERVVAARSGDARTRLRRRRRRRRLASAANGGQLAAAVWHDRRAGAGAAASEVGVVAAPVPPCAAPRSVHRQRAGVGRPSPPAVVGGGARCSSCAGRRLAVRSSLGVARQSALAGWRWRRPAPRVARRALVVGLRRRPVGAIDAHRRAATATTAAAAREPPRARCGAVRAHDRWTAGGGL